MSTCPRCGKWNGAMAAPAGTEPTWCVCGYARERREMDGVLEELAALRAQLADATRKGADLAIRHANDAVELDQLRTQLEEARADSTAALYLVARIREALGDNGKRMQDELIEYCRTLAAKDAEAQELRQSLQAALQRAKVTTRENETLHESLQRIERAYKDMGAQCDALQARVERLEGLLAGALPLLVGHECGWDCDIAEGLPPCSFPEIRNRVRAALADKKPTT